MPEKTSFLFPGQGSQFVGMGRDLAESHPAARAVFKRADDILGISLSGIMFGSDGGESDEEALRQTDITQPALYVHSLAVMAALTAEGRADFDMAAGHSLGEYSALAAAGALSFEDGLKLVRERGRLMAEAGQRRPGTMAAIIGMDDDAVAEACMSVESGTVQPANFNSPGQVVISGENNAVERAMAVALEKGARRTIPLPVSGAFHSPLMEFAKDGLATALAAVKLQAPACPIYLNVTARPTTDPEEIRARLLEQLTAPVRWSQTLDAMVRDGAARFVEIGAGKVLSGLVKRTVGRNAETAAVGSSEDIQSYLS